MDIFFEGDIAAFTEQTKETCRQILKDKGFTKCKVEVQTVGKKGDNYVANVKRLIVQQDDVNNGKALKIVVKLAPTIDQVRDMIRTDIAFSNEIIVYTELLPKYDELQEAANIPEKEKLKHPVCYGFSIDPPNETVLLEDICESGYTLLNRFVSMTDDQIKMALKDLAKFHALSYVLKVKDRDLYDSMKSKLVNLWIQTASSEQMDEYATAMETDTQNLLKIDDYKNRTKGLIKNMNKLAVEMHHEDIDSEYSAIIQGDCWTNNMMFILENDKPRDIIMLDYQITRVASPAVDFLHLTLNCTDYETRKANFNSWVDYYYKRLDDFLLYFDLKADSVYPKNIFEADMSRICKVSFGMSMMMSNVLVREPEDVIDFKEERESELSVDSFSVNQMRDVIAERYSHRVNGLIKTCIELGFL